jgi:hypothetical protein
MQLDERTTANLDVVLENACRSLPNGGGDHDSRKFIAKRLLRAAQQGKTTLGALKAVAHQARQKLSRSRPA